MHEKCSYSDTLLNLQQQNYEGKHQDQTYDIYEAKITWQDKSSKLTDSSMRHTTGDVSP